MGTKEHDGVPDVQNDTGDKDYYAVRTRVSKFVSVVY